MSSWAKTDAVGSAPLWAATMLNAEPSSANRTSLYGNTTVDTFITGATHGLFNYDTTETQSGEIAHTGWVLKTTGSGGRAGRVSYQTLVCLTSN